MCHPRTLIYLGVWSAIGLALLFALGTRAHTGLTVQPDRNPPFMLMSDGSVRNSYTVKLRNMQNRPRAMALSLAGLPGAVMWTDDMPKDAAKREFSREVAADVTLPLRVYVVAPRGTDEGKFNFRVTSPDGESASSQTTFNAPEPLR